PPKKKRQPKLPSGAAGKPCLGDWADLHRLLALGAILHFEFDLLVLLQGLEARALDFGEVGEEVLAAAIRFDEAEAFGVVEPLHGTGGHCVFPFTDKAPGTPRDRGQRTKGTASRELKWHAVLSAGLEL